MEEQIDVPTVESTIYISNGVETTEMSLSFVNDAQVSAFENQAVKDDLPLVSACIDATTTPVESGKFIFGSLLIN